MVLDNNNEIINNKTMVLHLVISLVHFLNGVAVMALRLQAAGSVAMTTPSLAVPEFPSH